MHPPLDLIPPENMYPVELRKSNIHGQGLFATRDILQGEVLTTYPCHLIGHTQKDGSGTRCAVSAVLAAGGFGIPCYDSKYSHFVYESPTAHVYVVGDPSMPWQRSACAHFINDPYPSADQLKISPDDYQNIEYVGKKMFEYYLRVSMLRNSALEFLSRPSALRLAKRKF